MSSDFNSTGAKRKKILLWHSVEAPKWRWENECGRKCNDFTILRLFFLFDSLFFSHSIALVSQLFIILHTFRALSPSPPHRSRCLSFIPSSLFKFITLALPCSLSRSLSLTRSSSPAVSLFAFALTQRKKKPLRSISHSIEFQNALCIVVRMHNSCWCGNCWDVPGIFFLSICTEVKK